MDVLAQFPPAFVRFLRENNVDPAIFGSIYDIPRYVRINPRNRISPREFSTQLQSTVTSTGGHSELNPRVALDAESSSDRKTSALTWASSPALPSAASSTSTSDASHTAATIACLRPTAIRDFFALSPPDVQIAHTAAYRGGQVYGIDVASGACVAALGRLRATDRVLDLCCAPGAKLCMIADLIATASDAVDNDGNVASIRHASAAIQASGGSMHHEPAQTSIPRSGFVVGVDVVAHRLAICKTLIRKYKIANAHVAHADGRLFNLGANAAAVTASAAGAQLLHDTGSSNSGTSSLLLPCASAFSAVKADQHASARIDADDPSTTVGIADSISLSSSGSNGIHPSDDVSDGSSASGGATGGKPVLVAKAKHPRKRTLRRQRERALAAAAVQKSAAGKVSASGGDFDDNNGDDGLSDSADNDDGGGVPDGQDDGEGGPSMLAPVTMAQIEALPPPAELYDKVLVDAECTHDGSLRHIAKFQKWGWPTFERRVLGAGRLRALAQLQRGLLLNGFRLLKPGGVLIYATCSFCRAQNEDVVQWLLDRTRSPSECANTDAAHIPDGTDSVSIANGSGAGVSSVAASAADNTRAANNTSVAASAAASASASASSAGASMGVAQLWPFTAAERACLGAPCDSSALPGTLRFDPLTSRATISLNASAYGSASASMGSCADASACSSDDGPAGSASTSDDGTSASGIGLPTSGLFVARLRKI